MKAISNSRPFTTGGEPVAVALSKGIKQASWKLAVITPSTAAETPASRCRSNRIGIAIPVLGTKKSDSRA